MKTSFHLFPDTGGNGHLHAKTHHRGIWKTAVCSLSGDVYRAVRARLIAINETGKVNVFFHS